MGSLAACLKLHGIDTTETRILRRAIKEYRKEGFTQEDARNQAVDDVIDMLRADRAAIVEAVTPLVQERMAKADAEEAARLQAEQEVRAKTETERQATASKDQKTAYKALINKQKKNQPQDTVLGWIEAQGRINYNKEHLKGELDSLAEGSSRIKALLNKKGHGLSLDELALRAKEEEGFISEATPEALLEAMAENRLKASAVEDQIGAQMEAEQRRRLLAGSEGDAAEEIVERYFATEGDLAGAHEGKTADGRTEQFTSTKAEIDALRADFDKIEQVKGKGSFDDIVLCLRREA